VDLDVHRGEIVALRGANGAGKTSLLRAIAGLLPLSSGEAAVLGLDPVADARALRPRIGLLGHRNCLYEDLSALENVRFTARIARAPKSAAEAALERLGLGGRLGTMPVSRLSAGQRRRVALAALLAREPELWLLDEPHAGLDATHRQLLDVLLLEATGQGATVVVASHEAATAAVLARRTVEVAGGAVTGGLLPADATGTPATPEEAPLGSVVPQEDSMPSKGPSPSPAGSGRSQAAPSAKRPAALVEASSHVA
jgi:heme ABC exporter ATP-binding subunit CcmA